MLDKFRELAGQAIKSLCIIAVPKDVVAIADVLAERAQQGVRIRILLAKELCEENHRPIFNWLIKQGIQIITIPLSRIKEFENQVLKELEKEK